MKSIVVLGYALSLVSFIAGCGDSDHPHGPDGHSHGVAAGDQGKPDEKEGHGGHGAAVPLGDATAGPFKVAASRDEGALKAGGDAAVDAVVNAGPGAPAIMAVRAWIGSADGKGALKAKLPVEDAAKPNHFHAHIGVPDPLAADHRLHVEIEVAGAKHFASFDLKR